jgi:hypothetical protein
MTKKKRPRKTLSHWPPRDAKKWFAFDYEGTQKWVEGEPARLLLLKQLGEDLENVCKNKLPK